MFYLQAVGAAVRYVGVERVLRAIPLDIVPANVVLTAQFQRSWLMPVLRVNIYNAPLLLAVKYFLPLAHEIRMMLPKLEPDVAKVYATIRVSILIVCLKPCQLVSVAWACRAFPSESFRCSYIMSGFFKKSVI